MRVFLLTLSVFIGCCSHAAAAAGDGATADTGAGDVSIQNDRQPQRSARIEGQVRDAETGRPIPRANVYLDGTNLGAAADERGDYRIDNIPRGAYTLIVRVIGYQTDSLSTDLEGGQSYRFDFSLTPVALPMQEVVKTAGREKRMHRPEISGFQLRSEQFTLIPAFGEKDVYRSLQLLPGVVFTSEYKSQLYVRGGNSDQNLVLLDRGIMYNPFHFSGILSSFDVDAIEQVSFYAGGFRAEYGGRLSSVLDIRTRASGDRVAGKFNISPLSSKILYEMPITRHAGILLTGRRSHASGMARTMGDVVEPDFSDAIGRLDVRPSVDDHICLSGFYGSDKVRLQKAGGEKGLTSENLCANLVYNRFWGGTVRTVLNYSAGRFKTTLPPALRYIEQPSDNELNDQSIGLKIELQPRQRVQLAFGGIYRDIGIRYRSSDPVLTTLRIDETRQEKAVYLQGQYDDGQRWRIEAGLRASAYRSGLSAIVEPRLSVQYQLYNFLALRAAYGRFSQDLVTLYNENDTYNPADIWLPPGTENEPATADHVIFGLSCEALTFIFTAEAYWKAYHSLTQYNRERLYPEDDFFVQGKGYSAGLDLSLQWSGGNWQLWTSYSLGKAQKEMPFQYPVPGIESFPPRYDRRHNVNVTLKYEAVKNLQLSSRFTICSGLPFSYMTGAYQRWSAWVINTPADYPSRSDQEPLHYLTAIPSGRNAFRFPWYHRLDLSVRYGFRVTDFEIHPYLQLINLYDQANVLYYDVYGNPYRSLPFLMLIGVEMGF